MYLIIDSNVISNTIKALVTVKENAAQVLLWVNVDFITDYFSYAVDEHPPLISIKLAVQEEVSNRRKHLHISESQLNLWSDLCSLRSLKWSLNLINSLLPVIINSKRCFCLVLSSGPLHF